MNCRKLSEDTPERYNLLEDQVLGGLLHFYKFSPQEAYRILTFKIRGNPLVLPAGEEKVAIWKRLLEHSVLKRV